jgi:hypothetical protein
MPAKTTIGFISSLSSSSRWTPFPRSGKLLDIARRDGTGDAAHPYRLPVSGNSYRHPGVLAKMAVTVDRLSGGCLDMGLGTGAGSEHAMLGVPLGGPAERVSRLEESCQVLKVLWTELTATFRRRNYQLDRALVDQYCAEIGRDSA